MQDLQHVKGLRELGVKLRELGPKLAKKHLKYAIMSGARLVRDTARDLAPVESGRLKKSIIIKFQSKLSKQGNVTYYVLAKRGKKYQKVTRRRTVVTNGVRSRVDVVSNEDAYYWRFVEFGTSRQAAQKFMRPAFEKRKREAVGLIADLLKKGIDQSVRVGT